MKHFLLIGFVLLLFTQCTVYKEYAIDIYQPGEIAIPPEAKNVAIVYRNFKYPIDTLQHYYKVDHLLKKAKQDPQELDSILANLCMNELAKNLKSQSLFNEIRIFPELFKPHSAQKLPTLTSEMVSTLTTASGTDLLIALETHSYFYSEYTQTEELPTKSSEVTTVAVWSVYNPYTQKLLDRETLSDAIFWNKYDNKGNYMRNTKLPPRLTALKIAAQMTGEKYAKRFSANWQAVKRYYSVPPPADFKAAEEYLLKGDWDNAIMLWKRYAADDNGRMAINARYNLAFGYEMKDDLDTALKWITAALAIASDYKSKDDMLMVAQYKALLQQRKKDLARLNQTQ